MATVYAVASAKGGVGKTTTTAAIATVLASSGADVVAIDADIGMANLAGALGVTPGEPTLHDVLAGRADPLDAVHEGPEGLRVVPGSDGLDAYASADPAGLTDAVAAFGDADYVLIDAGAGLSQDTGLPLAIADETLLVSTVERSALGDTEKTRQLTERLGGEVAGAAITRVDPDGDDGGVDGLAAAVLDAAVLGRIPEDEAVGRAATANRPLPTFAPDAPATRAYRDLARALTGADVEGAGEGGNDETELDGDETDDAELDDDQTDDAELDDDETAAAGATSGGGEDPVPEGDAEAETTEETVGEGHVDGDDLEAMIEDDVDEPEAFDGATATDDAETTDGAASEGVRIDDAESAPRTADEPEPDDGAATAEEPTPDPDDEPAGSVPFRDDDTGMDTVRSESAEDAAKTEENGDGAENGDGVENGDGTEGAERDPAGDEEGGDAKSGGFLSRLFGR